ncbi:MAG: permease-like cell division protein FtsX [Clostridia bacterium]|nr:permease-like cell division protein FtsX [Clostridia bacterium]
MRFNTFRFLVKEGVRSLRQNLFMSAASILVLVSCLLITGCAYLVYENVEHAFDWAYQQNVVVAYAKADVTDERATAMKTELEALDNVAQVEYISKEALLERYKDEFGELLEDLEADNPLQDAFVISFEDLGLFDKTVSSVKTVEGIDKVDYDQALSQTLVKVRRVVLTVGVWVIALLLIVSLFIIANTIKLTVYSRRREISIMRSVGATPWFVRFPFMVEGIILGSAAGVVSYGLLFGIYEVIRQNFTFSSSLELIPFVAVWWQLLLGFLVGGMITGVLGSTVSIGRYLKENTD